MNIREPSACRHCGISRRRHDRQTWHTRQRFTEGVGYHYWTPPTQQQIKERMLARRTNPNRWIPAADMRTLYRKWGPQTMPDKHRRCALAVWAKP